MNSNHVMTFALVTGAMLLVAGCGQQSAGNSQDAIKQAEAKTTVEAKSEYLIQQAKAFLKSEQYNDAIVTAQHILSQIDQNSQEAKSIIETAKAEMKKAATETMDKAKEEAGQKMDDAKNAIGNL